MPDPFSGRYVWHRPGALSVPAMRSAAAALVGEHDFASFCRHPGAGHSTVRDLQRLTVRREQDLVLISLRANAFLHQMVRVIVGTLVLVGQGRLAGDVVGRTLASRRRLALAKPAPARGLTLERVYYRRHRRTSTAPSRPT